MSDELVRMYYAYKVGNACLCLSFISFAAIIMYLIASLQLDKFSRTVFIVLVCVFASSTAAKSALPSLGEIKAYIAYRTHSDVSYQKEADRLIELITKYMED